MNKCLLRSGRIATNFKVPLRTREVNQQILKNKCPGTKTATGIPRATYGDRHMVTMIPGYGIGPELMEHVIKVLNHVGAPVDFEVVQVEKDKDGNEDIGPILSSIKRNAIGIKGNIETRSKEVFVGSRDIHLRNVLDLYANVTHCYTYPGVDQDKHRKVDIIVVRQNTEGEFSMLEHENKPGTVESMKIVTKRNSCRVARYAYEYAKMLGRRKVTIIHKADYLMSDSLFLNTCREVAKEYPDIKTNDIVIGRACYWLINDPKRFDVMLMPNLYGSIISRLLCGLVNGQGVLCSVNFGDDAVVYEPATRSKANTLVGKNCANPIAMLEAGIGMLRHIGLEKYAKEIDKAIKKTICDYHVYTPDIGGEATTTEVINCIIENINEISFTPDDVPPGGKPCPKMPSQKKESKCNQEMDTCCS